MRYKKNSIDFYILPILDFLYFSIFHKFPQIEKQGQHSKNLHLNLKQIFLIITQRLSHSLIWLLNIFISVPPSFLNPPENSDIQQNLCNTTRMKI